MFFQPESLASVVSLLKARSARLPSWSNRVDGAPCDIRSERAADPAPRLLGDVPAILQDVRDVRARV